ESALERRRGTTLGAGWWNRVRRRGAEARSAAGRRRRRATPSSRRGGGGGAGRRAQEETLAVLFDLGLGQRVEVGEDLWPGRAWRGFAHGGDAVLQFLFQHQGEEAAGDVAADGLVEFVINRPRFEQALGCAERPLHRP